MISDAFFSRKGALGLIFLAAVMGGGLLLWLNFGGQQHPLWKVEYEGRGTVLRLAGATLSDGRKIIVAGGFYRRPGSDRDLHLVGYDARDGKKIWVTDYEVKPSKSLHSGDLPGWGPDFEFSADGQGNIVVGWEYEGPDIIAQKLDGRTGAVLWETDNRDGTYGDYGVVSPESGPLDRVWLSGIASAETGAREEIYRFVAVLNHTTGAVLWQRKLNPARDLTDERATVFPLTNGDAIVVSPPRQYQGPLPPWTLQYLDGATGSVRWEHALVWPFSEDSYSLPVAINQPANQVVVCLSPQEYRSYDLATGQEQWRVEDDPFYSQKLSFDATGNILVWGEQQAVVNHINWSEWKLGWPPRLPVISGRQTDQLIRRRLDKNTGAMLEEDVLNPRDSISFLVPTNPPACLATVMLASHEDEWRVIRVEPDGMLGPRRTFTPSGDAAKFGPRRFDYVYILNEDQVGIVANRYYTKGTWCFSVW